MMFVSIEKELEEGKATGVFRKSLDSRQTALSLITVCFANFSNRYTLSRLFGADLCGAEMLAARKEHTARLILGCICTEGEE